MTRRRLFVKLARFLAPLVALFALPLFVLARSGELLPVGVIARRHHAAKSPNAVFGPAYTNPDKGFKMASLLDRDVPIASIGTSRVMQFRAHFFVGGEAAFYNAGGVVERLADYPRALAHLVNGTKNTRTIVMGIDHWMFNENWTGVRADPGVEREYEGDYSSLDGIQRSLRTYPDLLSRKLRISDFLKDTESMGVNGISHGNGFRRDGSYLYADLLRDLTSGADYQFADTMERMRKGVLRFEPGATPYTTSLEDLDRALAFCRDNGIRVVLFLPPFAPTVWSKLKADGRFGYMQTLPDVIRARADAVAAPFFDFSSCGHFACSDADFVNGFHGGGTVYARILLEMSESVPWLRALVDRPSILNALANAHGWDL